MVEKILLKFYYIQKVAVFLVKFLLLKPKEIQKNLGQSLKGKVRLLKDSLNTLPFCLKKLYMELYPLLKYKEFFIVFKGTKSVAKKGLIDPFSLVLIGFHWKPLLIYLLYILLNSRLNFLLFIIKIFLI